MKASELRDHSEDELRAKLKELQEELFNLRFQLATGQIENVGRIRTVRRDTARLKTIQRERQLAALLQSPNARH
jgi:large subunit ribosomal protein L29